MRRGLQIIFGVGLTTFGTATFADPPADRCQSYVGQSVAPVQFYVAAQPFTRLTPKGEYETTAQYEARRDALLGSAAHAPLIIAKDAIDRSGFRYDADAATLTIPADSFFFPSLDWWRALYAAHVSSPSASTLLFSNLAVVVAHNERVVGRYRGSNAFGVHATITRYLYSTFGIFDHEMSIGTSSSRPPISLHLAPAEAQRIRPLLRFAVVARPHEPYIAASSFQHDEPTIDNPEDVSEQAVILFGSIDCGLVIGPTNSVMAAIALGTDRADLVLRPAVPVTGSPSPEDHPNQLTGIRYRWDATPPAVIEPTRARANLASYISDADYPASAIRAHEQGRVSFRLIIGTDGRVSDCTITTSSGSAALDEATCRIMRSRARFTPAHDAQGNPIEDHMESGLNWILPTN
jgi:TonB family protein